MTKAVRASASAKLLLESGDADGACNRAYYAMYDAARAALMASNAPLDAEALRTHSGLISAFSMHLVKAGLVPVELGRTLNKAEEIRRAADYRGDRIDEEHARWAVEQGQTFVRTILDKFISAAPDAG